MPAGTWSRGWAEPTAAWRPVVAVVAPKAAATVTAAAAAAAASAVAMAVSAAARAATVEPGAERVVLAEGVATVAATDS